MNDATKKLLARQLKSARTSAESGNKIIDREGTPDTNSFRTAADQFRQAAKELDALDGMLQALQYEAMK